MLAPRSTAGSNRGPVQSAAPRVCAAHPHTAERGLSNGLTNRLYTKPSLAQHTPAPVALAASGLDQAVSIAGSRSLQGQAGARSSETHDTSKAGKFW